MNKLKQFILENKSFRWLLLITNWAYQGIPQADTSEKIYKILFSVFATSFVLLILGFSIANLVLAGFIGHTFNWLINCNISVILIHRMKYFTTTKDALFNYLFSIQNRLKGKDWILFSVSSGGIIRGSMNKHSDIDINVVRKPGFINALKGLAYAVIERKRADLYGIPLDVIISDSPEDCQKKTDFTDNIVVLEDRQNLVQNFYTKKLTLSNAKELNNQAGK